MSNLFINERAAELLFEYESFTDAEIGAIIRGVYDYDRNNKYPSFGDRAMNVICLTICDDMIKRRDQFNKHLDRIRKVSD